MVNNLFSAKSIMDLSPIVLDVVRNALSKAVDANKKGKQLDLQRLYIGVTVSAHS